MTTRRYGGPNGYGLNHDPAGHMRTPLSRLVCAGRTPAQSSLARFLTGPWDQGQTGRCTGFAKKRGIYVRTAKMAADGEKISPMLVSATGVYTFARCVDREPDARGKLPKLRDDGAMPNQVTRSTQLWGVVLERDWPIPDDKVTSKTVNNEPLFEEIGEASALRLEGEYTLRRGTSFVGQFRSAIAAGFPVEFSIDVTDAFENYSGGILEKLEGESTGAHRLLAYGYYTDPSGLTIAEVCNSWGDWGEDGNCRGDVGFISSWQDAHVLSVRPRD